MARWLRLVIIAVGAVQLTLLMTCGVWTTGRISRVKASALSPAGDVEAVCRGRLPESTEYDLWMRRWWQPFGTRAGFSGTESMGRCRQVLWSPDGQLVMVVNEGNYISLFDGRTGQLRGAGILAPGETGSYPSQRIVTQVAFLSNDEFAFQHCHRRFHRTHHRDDASQCDGVPAHGRARTLPEPQGPAERDATRMRIVLEAT
jgi:hypothetical protein